MTYNHQLKVEIVPCGNTAQGEKLRYDEPVRLCQDRVFSAGFPHSAKSPTTPLAPLVQKGQSKPEVFDGGIVN